MITHILYFRKCVEGNIGNLEVGWCDSVTDKQKTVQHDFLEIVEKKN